MKSIHLFIFISIISLSLAGCKDNDPQKEDVPEMITRVTLTFTPETGSAIIVTATDPDGDGIQNMTTDKPIVLAKSTKYTMSILLNNTLADPNSEAYNVTTEVQEEGAEHMFFFGWTGNAFAAPAGNGNIDNRADAVDYSESLDDNGLPLGIITVWTTTDVDTQGTFRVMLKHQPDLKSATSKSSDGETDLDITFDLSVE